MEHKLPNCEKAQVDDNKLYKYLLNLTHPDGKSKARFYELIGYTLNEGESLRSELLALACSGVVVTEQPNLEGIKYTIVGSINAPNGKTYKLLTVWAVEPPEQKPRLITAYPNH
jgi:hypothetical protein